MSSFNWLHISDLHYEKCKSDETFLRDQVMQDFFDCIEDDRLSEFLPLHAIFITGDLAFSGNRDEYGTKNNYGPVRQFLNELATKTGVEKEHIVIVPGNHDVNRRCIEPYHSIDHLPIDKEGSDKLFRSGKTLSLLGEKFADFVTLADEYPSTWRDGRYPYLARVFKMNNTRVGVIGINSAWFTSKSGEDQGHLFVGPSLLKVAFEELDADKPDLKVVLLHHPLDWLHNNEKSEVADLLSKNADLVLSGHLHHNNLIGMSTVHGRIHFVQTGALYPGYRHAKRFMVGRWLPSNNRFDIQPFVFRDDCTTSCWEIENANAGATGRNQPSYWVFNTAPGTTPKNKRCANIANDVSLESIIPESPIEGSLNRPLGCLYIKTSNPESIKHIDSVHYRCVQSDRDYVKASPIINRARKSYFAQTFPLYGTTEVETLVVFTDNSEHPLGPISLTPPMP